MAPDSFRLRAFSGNHVKPMPQKLITEITTDWSETDSFGHVNNVMFVKYVQSSRVRLFEATGLMEHFRLTNEGPMLASLSCRFIRQLHYPGKVRIEAGVEFTKNTSFGLRHVIRGEAGTIAAEAEDVIVFYDFGESKKKALPEWLLNAFDAYR